MAVHDMNQPYMIYEGPLPPHLTRPPQKAEEDEEYLDPLEDAPAGISGLATLLAVFLALAVGVGLGVWLTPILRPAPIATVASLTNAPPPNLITPATELGVPPPQIEAAPPLGANARPPALPMAESAPAAQPLPKTAPIAKPPAVRVAKSRWAARPVAHKTAHKKYKPHPPNDLALAYAQRSAAMSGLEDPPH
jgi:hypothetical protein